MECTEKTNLAIQVTCLRNKNDVETYKLVSEARFPISLGIGPTNPGLYDKSLGNTITKQGTMSLTPQDKQLVTHHNLNDYNPKI